MKLLNILPFLDDDDLKGLIEKIKNNEVKGVKYTHLYPFLSDKDIDELVDLLDNAEGQKVMSEFLNAFVKSLNKDVPIQEGTTQKKGTPKKK